MWPYQGKAEDGGKTKDGNMRVREIRQEAGLKEDNTTNRAEWRNKIISYTSNPR